MSLKQLTQKSYVPQRELEKLVACIKKRCALLESEERRKDLEEEFRQNCFRLTEVRQ